MHEVLEEEQWPVDAAEFSARWESVAWPQKLKRKQEECEAALAADRDQFQNEMVEEQAQFERDVGELAQRVANFHQYTDIARVTKVNAIVNEIQATLVEYEAKANLFNKRESLFLCHPLSLCHPLKIRRVHKPRNGPCLLVAVAT